MIDNFIQNHKLSQSAHEEIMAMAHSDKDVAFYFHKREIEMTEKIYDLLVENGFDSKNLMEKSHIAIGLIDNLCHEIVYHKHQELDYDVMTDICIETIVKLLNCLKEGQNISAPLFYKTFFLMKYTPPAKAIIAIADAEIINILLLVKPVGGVIINVVMSSSGSFGVLVLGL